MEQQDFNKLIDKSKYQVFLMICPASIPFNFVRHGWFVINEKGNIARWEVIHLKNLKEKTCWGYLYKNFLPPFKGIRIIWPVPGLMFVKGRWQPELLGFTEGDIAQKMAKVIENSRENFPYRDKYHFIPGPNSNTYIQWVLNQFPEIKIKLPWNSSGKNF